MRYGHFSSDGTEYVVTRPDTPRPWYNRFGNSEYSVVISQTGGGYSIAGDDDRYQLTWYVPRYDEAGRYLYLRDDASREVWSATHAPARAKLDRYECRHGLGWTTFLSRKRGIECEMTVFVPRKGPVELWRVSVTNRTRRRRRVTALPFVEWSIDDQMQSVDDLVYAATSDAEYEAATRAIVASRRDAGRYRFHRAFMSIDARPDSWDANRAAFVGAGGTLREPAAVARGRCTKTPAYAEVSVGAFSKKLSLAPGETATFHVMVGLAQTKAQRARLRKRFLSRGAPARELAEVRAFWANMPRRLEIKTPDRALDRFVNRWLAKHVHTMGATHAVRSIRVGFRNFVQDAMGALYIDPAISRRLLCEASGRLLSSGDALGAWSAGRGEAVLPKHVDPKVWLVLATCGYVRETGDRTVLRHRERFHDKPKKTTLLGKLHLVLERCWRARGPHGLSLIGTGDWNDNLSGMGPGGRGESVWMSEAVLWALKELAALEGYLGRAKEARKLRARAKQMHEAINRHGWDGEWYLMGYNDAGKRVGSKRTGEVALYLLPQAWAVLSGAADEKRQKSLFRAIDRKLATGYGPLLMDRPYTKKDASIGRITFLAAGMSENGPVYSHGAAFKVCADGVAGRGDALYADLVKLFPYSHDPARTLAEPFVVSNFYRPKDVPRKHGATHRSWTTSTPNWALRAVVEGLFGVRATWAGLEISPALPRKWTRASIRRRVRGDTFEIKVRKPRGRANRVAELWLDGHRLAGNAIPWLGDGRTHKVRVVMGR